MRGDWLAGHGTSVEDLATKTAMDWVLSLRRGLVELRKTCDRIVIIGDSFGGNLALHAAVIGPPIVGIVTLGAPVSLRSDLRIRLFLPLLKHLRPFHRKRWVKDPAAHLAKGSYVSTPVAALGEVITFIDRHTKCELAGVTQPLLIVQARHDFETDPWSAHFIFEHVGSIDKELVWVDERIHHVLSSSQSDALTERIVAFIRRVTAAS